MKSQKTYWLIIIGLLILSIVPVAAGIYRLSQLASGVVTPENHRFFNDPIPGISHIISIAIFGAIGAFQFLPSLRGKKKWHRISGQLIFACGMISAVSGLWMAQFYKLPSHDGIILYYERLIVGFAMIIFLIQAYIAIKQRNFIKHRDFMIRSYAIGMGAGTQVITNLPWMILIGEPTTFERAILMGLGWLINVIIAEIIVYKLHHKLTAKISL